MDDITRIGQRIRYARRRASLNQTEACTALKLSRPTYIAIESGKRQPKPTELIALATLFGCEVSSLVADCVTRRNDSPLHVAADLCEWTARLDAGDVSEGCYAKFVGVDRVTARVIAESCRAMAKVVTAQVQG